MGEALDKVTAADSDADMGHAHAMLMRSCRWYSQVAGGKSASPEDTASLSCLPAARLLALTPHTAEASTVHKPTRPPGGPGLFRIKGKELPPYMQHLWFHLVKEYGPHKAYGVAVGIVKKWAAGINPGGKGKGHKVHADVQAAAAKNVAEWVKDRGEAHAHSAARASAKKDDIKAAADGETLALALINIRGFRRFERGREEFVRPHEEMDSRLGSEGELRQLAGKVRDAHGALAATHVSAAADSVRNGRYSEASGHLRDAYGAIAQHMAGRGVAHDAEHQAAQGNMDAIRQHMAALRDKPDTGPKPANDLEEKVRSGHTDSDEKTRQTMARAGYSQGDIEDHFARRWNDQKARSTALEVEKTKADVGKAAQAWRRPNPMGDRSAFHDRALPPVAGGV